MISLAEPTTGFSGLVRQYKRLGNEIIMGASLKGEVLQLEPTRNAFRSGMEPGRTYLVKGGMLGVQCQNRKLFTYDEGDLVLPDVAGEEGENLIYYAESPVLLVGYDTLEMVRNLLADDEMARQWTRLLMTAQGLLVRLLTAHVEEETQTTPGFAYYQPGDEIIRQGEPADYVLSLFEGSADVLVDDVEVGQVGEGEVVGALAVLTHSKRSATVRARERCSVVKVPKDQFKTLIRSNPGMIHGLLTDMARQIINLNSQVVELSGQGSMEKPG